MELCPTCGGPVVVVDADPDGTQYYQSLAEPFPDLPAPKQEDDALRKFIENAGE